jgi:hypothetical protein
VVQVNEGPQFCPWCGSPTAFFEHEHEPRLERLLAEVRAAGKRPTVPPRIGHLLAGESYVGACQGCRTITHVIGHRAPRP